ncbi:MAG: sodium-dependent transporter [Lachnospiraceae bacterium]|nr:sodium-dependent transporter [Lachnospiraceae bacterium]
MKKEKNRNSFSGSIGFVLAAAGSAVGLGNIWRFPYLAAKDGGGLYLVLYLILALTFGFTLLTTEIAIGRKTKQSPLTAYGQLKSKSGFLGVFACLVPIIIMPYYCVIGGWVVKYFIAYLTGEGSSAATDGYFTDYISEGIQPIILMAIFLFVVAFIIFRGVNKGIESFSKILMPLLLLLVVGIAVFSMTIHYTEDSGVTRTGLEGFKIYVVPDFEGLTVKGFFTVLLDAMGQLFFSLSVAMGIMIAYGSYVKDDANLVKSINQIEIFDTVVAFLAGVMIIPAVYTFMGKEGMKASGPSLMFVSLPKVFVSMGKVGSIVGVLFFAMVLFAAITSAVSVMEAVVSSLMDKFHMSRIKASAIETGIESFSKILMPLLLLLVVGIAVFSMTIHYTEDSGVTRTGLEGFKIYVVPDFEGLTVKGFFTVLLDAMGQLFFSLSVAMGIMIAYGSYVKDDANLVKSINQIEIFDTVVAFLAGVMIIPAVYTFMGKEGMKASGPSLMFVSLPKVFVSMGKVGSIVGVLFFAMVLFAAITSAVSVMEAVVSSLMDKFHMSRIKASAIETGIALIGGIIVCLGYNKLYFDITLPNGAHAQILDIMDYISNNCLMPLVAIGTCILIGWIIKPSVIIEEVEKSGCKFGRKKLYIVMVKYIAPVLLVILLLKSFGILTFI